MSGTGRLPIGKQGAHKKTPSMRLWNPTTRMWLHLSGQGETKDRSYAWSGYGYQARALRAQAESWPYVRAEMSEGAQSIENDI